MGRMAILKKVDDLPVRGMGIVIDMAVHRVNAITTPPSRRIGLIEATCGRGAGCCEANERLLVSP